MCFESAGHHPVTIEVLRLFQERGDSQYGREAVTQLEHALQAAFFASRSEASSELITAALVHDIGHLLHELPDDAPQSGVDDRHEELAATWLCRRFGQQVVQPVRLHVAAKRFLCATDVDYVRQLSPPSQLSLRLQGGPMSDEEVLQFQTQPFWESAVALRRWDDAAKVMDLITPALDDFAFHVDKALRSELLLQ